MHDVGVRAATPPNPGLCEWCRHARIVTGARSSFLRCGLADSDDRFSRYPTLPVLRCAGFTRVDSSAADPPAGL